MEKEWGHGRKPVTAALCYLLSGYTYAYGMSDKNSTNPLQSPDKQKQALIQGTGKVRIGYLGRLDGTTTLQR